MIRKPAILSPLGHRRAASTDFDDFRVRAVALRGEAKRELAKLRVLTASLLTIVAVTVVYFAAAAGVGAARDSVEIVQTEAKPIR